MQENFQWNYHYFQMVVIDLQDLPQWDYNHSNYNFLILYVISIEQELKLLKIKLHKINYIKLFENFVFLARRIYFY